MRCAFVDAAYVCALCSDTLCKAVTHLCLNVIMKPLMCRLVWFHGDQCRMPSNTFHSRLQIGACADRAHCVSIKIYSPHWLTPIEIDVRLDVSKPQTTTRTHTRSAIVGIALRQRRHAIFNSINKLNAKHCYHHRPGSARELPFTLGFWPSLFSFCFARAQVPCS